MNYIDELIERLQEWAENEPDLTGYGGKVLKAAITALQEMQENYNRVFQRALDAEQKNKEFNEQFSKHQSTWWDNEDKLQQRIAELEKWNTEMVEKAASGGVLEGYREMGAKIERLDAALGEIIEIYGRHDKCSIIAKKARASERE